jgi:rhodanese-related sulfurtransferase
MEVRRALSEALLVALLGLIAALGANFISPRGLSLTRDYFPARDIVPSVATASPSTVRTLPRGAETKVAVTPPLVDVAPKMGITTLTTAQAQEWFNDPQFEQELIVFVDARDSRQYEAGHIPGAYQLDRYYPQNHLPTVLPACLNALRVVVYCTGGQCEDSHFAAQLLQDAGIPAERLSVYSGGITEWDEQRLPIETGTRKSGVLKERKP